MDTPQIVLLDHPDALAQVAADQLAALITQIVARQGRCALALAGGGTPRAIYAALATHDALPWDQLQVYFGDERCVPPDHDESNFRMAHEALLGPRALSPAQIFRMEGEREDRDAAAADYAAALPERLDIVLLGMGPDGHTASLFPGDAALDERARLVVPVFGPKPPPWRLTLTLPALERAAHLWVFALGASKADKLAEVMTQPVDCKARPIQVALRGRWFLDADAAARLPAALHPRP